MCVATFSRERRTSRRGQRGSSRRSVSRATSLSHVGSAWVGVSHRLLPGWSSQSLRSVTVVSVTVRGKGGRPRKWRSDADRVRAFRARQRGEHEPATFETALIEGDELALAIDRGRQLQADLADAVETIAELDTALQAERRRHVATQHKLERARRNSTDVEQPMIAGSTSCEPCTATSRPSGRRTTACTPNAWRLLGTNLVGRTEWPAAKPPSGTAIPDTEAGRQRCNGTQRFRAPSG